MLSSGHIGTDPHIELAKGLDYVNVPEIYLFLVRQPLSEALSFARVLGRRLYKSWAAPSTWPIRTGHSDQFCD